MNNNKINELNQFNENNPVDGSKVENKFVIMINYIS